VLTYLLVKLVVHSFLAVATDTMLDVVAVVPLIPGKVVEANKQAFNPSLEWPTSCTARSCSGAVELGAIV